jgi:hypothetical protein
MLKMDANTTSEMCNVPGNLSHVGRAVHRPHPARRVAKRARSYSVKSDLPDSITARRNVLAALWAGKLKGLSGEELSAYARDVRFVTQRDDAIVGALTEDLIEGGVSLSCNDVQQALSRFHRVALLQTCATD